MSKSQTVWSNGNKNTDAWILANKSTSIWANDIGKKLTPWIGSIKNSDNWSNESVPQLGYLYDSLAVYDSNYTYDFTMMVANQSNNKNLAVWTVVV